MEIKETISKYVLTEKVGHKVLSINIEINYTSRRYSITSYDELRREFGFIGTDKTEEVKVICGMISRAAEFADERLRDKEGGYPLVKDVFKDKLLIDIGNIMDKECIIYHEACSDISIFKFLSTSDLEKYDILDAGTINYIISTLGRYKMRLRGE